mmetsp:Transcript_45814/g.90237  ORF Transcript_45814/g.90237 Transcript_45814/m.90237 type:complete len:255 (-) Transcript_45814:263-1027(-)
MSGRLDDPRIYVGGLPGDANPGEVEKLFEKYGVVKVDGPKRQIETNSAFAFVTFKDIRDAEDAIQDKDGHDFPGGYKIKVQAPRSRGPYSSPSASRGLGWKVVISRLPEGASWQDIKDHFRRVGPVAYANVNQDGTGVCEFPDPKDAHAAVKDMDGTEMKSHTGERGVINVDMDTANPPEDAYRGPPPARNGYGGGGYGRDRYDDRRDRGYDRGYDRGGYDRYDDRGRGGYDDRYGGRRDRSRSRDRGYGDRRY